MHLLTNIASNMELHKVTYQQHILMNIASNMSHYNEHWEHFHTTCLQYISLDHNVLYYNRMQWLHYVLSIL